MVGKYVVVRQVEIKRNERFKINEVLSIEQFCGPDFTDERDQNEYKILQIGSQCWMKENLAYLPEVSPSNEGSEFSAHHYVYGYENNIVKAAKTTSNYQTYGVLYNWQAAVKACPKGWHLPTDDEWTLLIDFLGGENLAGGKMKETGTSYWNSPNILAKNESGFSGLPGGNRYSDGGFDYIGNISIWWSSTKYSPIHAWIRLLNSNYGYIGVGNYNMQNGLSVRCISDIETNNEGKATIKKSSKIEQICDSSFADIRDGNQYQTVKIGNQCWMKENLAYLPNVSPASQISDTIAFYYVYDYKDSIVKAAKASSNYETYGVLYNWQAAVKACPKGWHLPSDSEWRLLIDNLGGENCCSRKNGRYKIQEV